MSGADHRALLTLEPLIDAVRQGVEEGGWALSGLQKTTSHQFEGRWDGESTRSAYLFFHSEGADFVSIDVYLDETSRGLSGNLALVVDLVPLGVLSDGAATLARLGALSARSIAASHGRPVTLRLRLEDASTPAAEAESEVRFKVRIPRRTIAGGEEAVRALAREAVASFERILAAPELRDLTDGA